jgi:hypothetical protein
LDWVFILGLGLFGLFLLACEAADGRLLSSYTDPDLLKFLDGIVLAVRCGWINLKMWICLDSNGYSDFLISRSHEQPW